MKEDKLGETRKVEYFSRRLNNLLWIYTRKRHPDIQDALKVLKGILLLVEYFLPIKPATRNILIGTIMSICFLIS